MKLLYILLLSPIMCTAQKSHMDSLLVSPREDTLPNISSLLLIDTVSSIFFHNDTTSITDTINVDYVISVRTDGLLQMFWAKKIIHRYKSTGSYFRLYGEPYRVVTRFDHEWTVIGADPLFLKQSVTLYGFEDMDGHGFNTIEIYQNDDYWKGRNVTNKTFPHIEVPKLNGASPLLSNRRKKS